jgi:hypothetical protein
MQHKPSTGVLPMKPHSLLKLERFSYTTAQYSLDDGVCFFRLLSFFKQTLLLMSTMKFHTGVVIQMMCTCVVYHL